MSCTSEGCDKKQLAKGLCSKHYWHTKRYGAFAKSKRQLASERLCTIEGCNNPHDSKGLCSTHRMQKRRLSEDQKIKDRAYTSQYKKDNLDQTRADVKARGRRVRQATPVWSNIMEIKDLYLATPKTHDLDHIIPLTHPDVCGLHVIWNLQALTKSENNTKKNKFDGTYDNDSWRKLLSKEAA